MPESGTVGEKGKTGAKGPMKIYVLHYLGRTSQNVAQGTLWFGIGNTLKQYNDEIRFALRKLSLGLS